MGHVDQQPDRSLRQRLDDRGRRGDDHVGRRRAETVDEKSTNPRPALREHDETRDLGGDASQVERLAGGGHAEADGPGGQREPVALDRFDVARVNGRVVRKALVAGVVRLLDVLDDRDEVVEFDRVGIEEDHCPSDDGVDLGPVDALEPLECVLEVTEHRRVTRIADAAHLDVSPAVGDGGVPLPASLSVAEPRGQTANRGERVEPDRKRDHQTANALGVGRAGCQLSLRPGRSPSRGTSGRVPAPRSMRPA